MARQDFLSECNEFGIPAEDFGMQHCARCFQSECTRSLHGKGQFDQRVSTWEQRLFTDVPRMDESDPRFEVIRSKRFVEFDASPVPEIGRSEWVDPRDLAQPEAEPVAEEVPKLDVSPPEPQISEAPGEAAPTVGMPMNTPNQPGQMIGGHEKPTKSAPSDPWEPKKTPESPKERVVKPGARIRFDGSGV